MTRADELEGLVAKLRTDAGCLRKSLEHVGLGGAGLGVRVKDPEALLAVMCEAADALVSLGAEVERLKHDAGELVVAQYELSAVKADRENLAECNALIGQDLREALDRADALTALLNEAREVLIQRDGGVHDQDCKANRLSGLPLCTCGHVGVVEFLDKTGDR